MIIKSLWEIRFCGMTSLEAFYSMDRLHIFRKFLSICIIVRIKILDFYFLIPAVITLAIRVTTKKINTKRSFKFLRQIYIHIDLLF